jgi:benzoyl-CoA reductase subunit B
MDKTDEVKYQYQGLGRDYQKDLLTNWYKSLSTAEENREPVAYLFIPGNIGELLRVFDMRLVYPEVNALQCGIKKTSLDFILKSEDMGYSPDVCGYVKNDVGLLSSGNVGPFGKLPRPSLLVCTYSGCRTFVKWFEALAEFYGAEIFMLDIPYLRSGEITKQDMDYIVGQLRELIKACERVTGKKYEEVKLQNILKLSVEAENLWNKILDLAQNNPSPFDAYFEAVFFMAPIYVLRGTQECVDYYKAVMKEMNERIEHKIGPVSEEKFRVVIEGPPPWPHFRNFWEMLKKWGVCAVGSSYSKVGGIWDRPLPVKGNEKNFRHNPEKPLESLAEYALNCYTNLNLLMRADMLLDYYKKYNADGFVIHSVKSCRSFSVGQADFRESFSKDMDIPTLFIESDLADPRYFQAAQLKNRIDAFFEALEHKKYFLKKS